MRSEWTVVAVIGLSLPAAPLVVTSDTLARSAPPPAMCTLLAHDTFVVVERHDRELAGAWTAKQLLRTAARCGIPADCLVVDRPLEGTRRKRSINQALRTAADDLGVRTLVAGPAPEQLAERAAGCARVVVLTEPEDADTAEQIVDRLAARGRAVVAVDARCEDRPDLPWSHDDEGHTFPPIALQWAPARAGCGSAAPTPLRAEATGRCTVHRAERP